MTSTEGAMKRVKSGISMSFRKKLLLLLFPYWMIHVNLMMPPEARGQSGVVDSYPILRPVQPPFTPDGAPPILLAPNAYSPYANDPFSRPWPANDLELRRNIRTRFGQDSFLHPFGIHVEVREGFVTLSGIADTVQDRDRAALDAYAAGAAAVDNQLQVQSR